MFRVRHLLVIDIRRYFLNAWYVSSVSYQSPISHLVIKIVDNFTIFIPTRKIVFTNTFTTKLPFTLIHDCLEEICFISQALYITFYFIRPLSRIESTAANTLQCFFGIVTRSVKFIDCFSIHQQNICKTHTYTVDTCIRTTGSTQRRLHIEFGPFTNTHTSHSHINLLIQVFIIFIRYTSHITTQIILIKRINIRTAESYIVAGAAIRVLTFCNSNTDIIAITTGDTFQHRNSEHDIIVVGSLPVTFIYPQVFKTLSQVVFAFFDYLPQISDGNLIIMFKVIISFHVTYVSHIFFVGTKSPTTPIESQLSDKRLAIFA